ncbi:33904_t:CDS:2, partial [Racocetra persica]
CIIADLDLAQVQDLGLVLNEIDKTKSWEDHLVHIFKSCHVHYKRNILNKKYDNAITNNMLGLLTADSEDAINKLFDNIQLLDENLKDNNISQIDNNIWRIAPNNTNVAEATHALSNQRGKGHKLDKERFMTINIHQQYNIPQQGHSKGLISRNFLSNKRKVTESEDTNESSNEGSSKSDKLEYLE